MARKPHAYHFIYKTTCNITNKFYIGMHSTSNLEDGYLGSGTRITYSIRKYGKENHNREILEHFTTRESLKLREIEIINSDLLKNPLCINLCLGGAGTRYGATFPNRKSSPLSESHRANLSKAMKGIAGTYERTPEIREKIANTLKDQKQSEETRKKRSESQKKYWKDNPEAKEKKIESTLSGWETRRRHQRQ
jgi:hypothetical protein